MQKLHLVIGFSILLFSCNKSDPITTPNCKNPTGSIIGRWDLVANRSYSIPGAPNPSWQTTNKSNIVTIIFSKDSSFNYNSNFNFSMDNYNRFTVIDSVDFRIYSTSPPSGGNFPHYLSVFVKMNFPNEIVLTYMGVDAGVQEKYDYSCTN
ncbi:hypothetical protein FW778_17040 [Ginsengibacter hankyongi]|uniref:Uncharacterized protein n=1 Tax=Ginsengibacter hankyongi TaxID=2607284 RepID=A0A5J5IG81_9BACT|nr:hypothetical protein [Ginsengibacter hankyongi]KAA9037134.1 hypothetical protein FW778_17040 [Ginsengibacter hankyongi]